MMDKFEKGLAIFGLTMVIFVIFVDLYVAPRWPKSNDELALSGRPDDAVTTILGPSEGILEAFYEAPGGGVDLARLIPDPYRVFTDEEFGYSGAFDEVDQYGFVCVGVNLDMFRRYRLACKEMGFRAGELTDERNLYSAESLSGEHILKVWWNEEGDQDFNSMIVRVETNKG